MIPSAASAQTVYQYTNSTTGAITDSTTCATVVTRTFTISTAYAVNDVNLGVAWTHNSRDHLRLSLTSPSGTTVALMTNVGGSRDHLSVLFDDEAASAITTHTASNDSTSAVPPYQRTFRPENVLSAFDGQSAAGTWTMRICDSVSGTTGTFTRADLYIAPREADLSLTKTVSNAAPNSGANITYTLGVTNAAASSLTATGIQVLDQLPLGVNFVSATGTGSYSSGTGIWTVGSLAPGASASITITVSVNASAGVTITNDAEVSASSALDGDSSPNNGSTTEDDDAFVSFTVAGTQAAGTPPTLICPVGSSVFDWDTRTWTAGSLNNSYTLTNVGSVAFAITNPGGGVWQNDPAYGGLNPTRQNADDGGFAGQHNLLQWIDFPNRTVAVTTTITLATAVPRLQFRIFDIDYFSGQFTDKVTVTGSFGGTPVMPVLTNGVSNVIIGNSAVGISGANDSTTTGNIVVTFQSPVDTVTFVYGNDTNAPTDPTGQSIALHDITFCNPQAVLSVTKISSVIADGTSVTNFKSIPGATVRYCITATNTGSGTATSVSASDVVPVRMTYIPGSMTTGASCGTASTAEDDNNSGADETDPFGMSISGTTINGRATTLAPSASVAFVFLATVN